MKSQLLSENNQLVLKIQINVTQNDINQAIKDLRNNKPPNTNCPVARAVKRITKLNTDAGAITVTVQFGDNTDFFNLDNNLSHLAQNFDLREFNKLKPTTGFISKVIQKG